jgi:flagellar hook-associated protein 1 FlgK
MAIGSVMQNALSGLLVNQTALSVTSNNISNVNNPNYVRRQVAQQERVLGGQGAGVEIAAIQRVADQFLAAQGLGATSEAARYQAASDLHTRIQSLLGDPSSDSSLAAQIDQIFASLGALTVDPTSSANRSAAVSQLNQAFSEFGRIADGLNGLRGEADQRIAFDVSAANDAIAQINSLNKAIQSAQASGGTPNDLLDQRDAAVKQLSQLMDVRVTPQANGRITVLTGDGTQLVGEGYVKLQYDPAAPGAAYGAITAYQVSALTGEVSTDGRPLDVHIASGEIRGLIDMRDQTLPGLSAGLSELAGTLADGLNAAQDNATSVPPPSVLTGRQTGLLAGDDSGFTGRTTIAVVDPAGTLVRRVDVDFDAGTVSTDGGAPVALAGTTLGDLVDGINSALGGAGSVSFAGGVLTLQATGGNGVAIQQDPTAPSERAGRGFAQFFGLNDLVRTGTATDFATGLDAADASGFAAGQSVTLRFTKPDGTAVQRTVDIGGGTVGDAVAALNDPASGFGGIASFTLDGDGALTVTPTGSYADANLQVVADTTARGDTGVTFSNLFGLSADARFNRAGTLTLGPQAGSGNGSGLGTATLSLDASTMPGATVLAAGDTSGATALQAVGNTPLTFDAAGAMGAVSRSVGQYASDLLSLSGSMANQAANMSDSRNAVKNEIDQQMASVSGVNLDEELVNMMTYQKAYSASARLIQVADQMMQDLLGLVGN